MSSLVIKCVDESGKVSYVEDSILIEEVFDNGTVYDTRNSGRVYISGGSVGFGPNRPDGVAIYKKIAQKGK